MATRIPAKRNKPHSTRQPLEITRRSPHQQRALDTVEAIFEAMARILEGDGLDAANTNRISELAGISIGTLYQYFPNKTAILVAMARRQLEKDRAALQEAIAGLKVTSIEALTRASVRALIRVHRENHQVRRHVMQVHHAQGFGQEHVTPVQDIADWLGTLRQGDQSESELPPGSLRLFVVSRAVIGVIRSATLENPALLDAPGFEEEVIALASRYIGTAHSGT